MLAQGQASSAKGGGLAVVSSRLIFLKKKKNFLLFRDQPSSIVVKFACSALAAWGSQVRIPGADLSTAYQAMPW